MSAAFDAKLREERLRRAARVSADAAAMKPQYRRVDGKGPMNEPLRPPRDTPSRARPHLRDRVAALEAEVSRLRLLMEDVTR